MEQRVQKALNFLKNPKGNIKTVSSLPTEKKIEFLRSKLSPAELEEVIKKLSEADFDKYFEPATVPEQEISNKWNFKILGTIGAIIIGAVGSAFFTVVYI
jgi:predicted nucleic acid-binding protein